VDFRVLNWIGSSGDSLLQIVLDDDLLALGRAQGQHNYSLLMSLLKASQHLIFAEPSFQILHAIHSLESVLCDFQKRSAAFEIIFFHGPSSSVFSMSTN